MDEGHVGVQKRYAEDAAREPRTFEEPVEELLVGGGDLFSPPGACTVEGYVVGVLGETGAVGLAVAPAPVGEQVIEERAYLRFVGLVVRGRFAVHGDEDPFWLWTVTVPTAELRPAILEVAYLG